jgi:hypothetical protein
MSKPTRQEALAAGLKRYFGKVCSKHPELEGERWTAHRGCRKCKAAARKRVRYYGKICAKHPKLNGERYPNRCCVKYHNERGIKRRATPVGRAKKQALDRARRATPEYQANERARFRKRKQTDPQFRLRRQLAVRLCTILRKRGLTKSERTLDLVGCSVAFLVQHLERQFWPGMSWENRHLWHIDHIRPCASFDLTKLKERRACFHYTNLQPLWGPDNGSKGAKTMEEWLATRK